MIDREENKSDLQCNKSDLCLSLPSLHYEVHHKERNAREANTFITTYITLHMKGKKKRSISICQLG